jgi:hypothetical protein
MQRQPQTMGLLCLFVFISSTMRFSRHGLGASYLATHNHSAAPDPVRAVTHRNNGSMTGATGISFENSSGANTRARSLIASCGRRGTEKILACVDLSERFLNNVCCVQLYALSIAAANQLAGCDNLRWQRACTCQRVIQCSSVSTRALAACALESVTFDQSFTHPPSASYATHRARHSIVSPTFIASTAAANSSTNRDFSPPSPPRSTATRC